MPTAKSGFVRLWSRGPVGTIVGTMLLVTGCGVLAWNAFKSPNPASVCVLPAEAVESPVTPLDPDPVPAEPLLPTPAVPPALLPPALAEKAVPEAPPADTEPVAAPERAERTGFGPRTPRSVREFPDPTLGIERFSREERAEPVGLQLVLVGGTSLYASPVASPTPEPFPPIPDALAQMPGAGDPVPVRLPPVPEALPPVTAPPPDRVPEALPPVTVPKPDRVPDVLPPGLNPKPNPPAVSLPPLPTAPIPVPTVTVPTPAPNPPSGVLFAPVPSVGDLGSGYKGADVPAPAVGPVARPASTLLIAVPGVGLPVPPPRLVPLPKPAWVAPPAYAAAKPLAADPVLAAAPQEKLPEPKKLDVPADAALRLSRARNAVQLGDLALAISEYEQYIALVPNDHKVRFELAGVYVQAEKFATAAAAYQELIRRDPANSPRYLVAVSDLLARMKDYRNAIAALRRAIDLLDPAVPGGAAARADAAARLARVHLFDDDLPAAFDVIQKYLAAFKPGDEGVPIRYVSLLLDLERAKDAQPFLEPFLKALAKDPLSDAEKESESEVLVNSVRLSAQLNDKRKALDGIELLAKRFPKNVGVRLQLAENLLALEDFDTAAVVFGQISQLQPNHVPSQLAQVRMLIRQFRLTQAKALLETVRPVTTEQVLDASLVRGQYHAAAGQYTEARYFYQDILRQFPVDPDARIGLGATYELARDLEKAKAEYSKVPAQSRGWRVARRGLATVLAAQRRTTQALEVLIALQREAPWDHQTVLVFAQISTRNGGAAQAAEAAGAYLAGGSPTPSTAAAVEGALGLSLLALNKVSEAEAAFRSALAVTYNKSIVGHYGMSRVSQRLGGGSADMGCPPEFVGDEIRYRLVMSDLFTDDHDDRRAFDHAFAAMRADPQNLAALIRVADIQQRLARESGAIDDAVATAKTVLVVSPTNVRGHLTLARSFSIGRNYKAAADVYQKLISLDSDYTLPKRELARIYYADHRYDQSHDTYLSIAGSDPEVALRAALQTISERAPGAAQVAQLMAGAPGQLAGLAPDLTRMATAQADPIIAQAILAALADYEARADEAKGGRMEDLAKSQRNLRDRSAVGAYRSLIEQEPGNLDALFDLGQVYRTLQQTRESSRTYNELLAADPLSREAQIVLERNQAEMSPSYRPSILYDEQTGRNGLAQIKRFRLNQLVTLPLGDQNEYLGVAYSRVNYRPQNDRDLDGNIASFILQKKTPGYDQLLFRTQLNYEQYADRLSNRATGDVGVVNNGDGYVATGALFLDNVVENAESLRQDIYRYGGRLTGEYQVNRRIDVGGLYRFAYYSDVNVMNEFNVHSAYRFTYLPTQLRLIVSVDGLFYGAQSTFGPLNPVSLVGTTHPYFAPSSYTYYETRLEWTHVIGRDLFGGANNLAYIASYGLGTDNNFNSYNRFRVDVNWEVKSWLSLGVAGQYTYSSVYKYGSIFGYVTIRLPHLYHL